MRVPSLSQVLLFARDLSTITFAALVLAVATMLGWQVLLVVCVLAACLMFVVLLHARAQPSRDWVLLLALAGMLVLPTAARLTGLPFIGAWQFALMALSVLGVARFGAELGESGWLRLALAFFFIYLLFGIASSVVEGRTSPLAGIYQFISDLKPMLLLLLGYALRWDDRMERWLWAVLRWAWLPALVFLAFEWGAPGLFRKLLYPGQPDPLPYSFLLFPSRAMIVLDHPSFLATTSALFAVLIASRACSEHADHKGHTLRWVALAGVYGVLLLCSGSRQEMLGCTVALACIALLSRPDRVGRRLLGLGLVAVVLTVSVTMPFIDQIQQELATWGIGNQLPIENPRAQLYVGGFEIAQRLWPFGSGLGTYGGAGAQKFDPTLYYELGFGRYWWFGKEAFLMDTYWPNPIAEKGILGAASLLLCYVALFFFAATRAVSATPVARGYWFAAAAMMVYMLQLSLTSPAFQDPRLFMLPAAMFGIASQWAKREASEKKPGSSKEKRR